MAQDEQHGERSDRLIRRLPAGSLRVLFLAGLVAQALGLHGASTSPDVSLTITNYRVSVLRARAPAHFTAAEKDRTAKAEKKH